MTMPYSKTLRVEANAGANNCYWLPAPWRGVLERLIVKQTSGVLSGFTVELYNRDDVCEGDSLSAGNNQLDREVYKILPTTIVASGQSTYENFTVSAPYENDNPGKRQPAPSYIYLLINPLGTGIKQFDLGWTCDASFD